MSEVINNNFYGYNGKIADISESDTNKHTLDLSGIVPENTVALILWAKRISGSGNFFVYSNEGPQWSRVGHGGTYHVIIGILNHRLQYKQSTADDDWDLYMFGYFVEGRR